MSARFVLGIRLVSAFHLAEQPCWCCHITFEDVASKYAKHFLIASKFLKGFGQTTTSSGVLLLFMAWLQFHHFRRTVCLGAGMMTM